MLKEVESRNGKSTRHFSRRWTKTLQVVFFLATTSGIERPESPSSFGRLMVFQRYQQTRLTDAERTLDSLNLYRQTKCMKLKFDSCTSWSVSEMFPYGKGWLFMNSYVIWAHPSRFAVHQTRPKARCVRLAVSSLWCWAFCWCAGGATNR